jgi:hypothetical protein
MYICIPLTSWSPSCQCQLELPWQTKQHMLGQVLVMCIVWRHSAHVRKYSYTRIVCGCVSHVAHMKRNAPYMYIHRHMRTYANRMAECMVGAEALVQRALYMHTNTHTHTSYTYIQTHTHTSYTYIHTHTRPIHIYKHTHTFYTYIQRHTHTHILTRKQTFTHTERWPSRWGT